MNYDVLKSKSPCILLNKSINLSKNKTECKWKTPHTVLERRTLCFSSYKNRKLKVKIWWVEGPERTKRAFFVPFTLSEENFLNIFLSQCIVYWIHFQYIHTSTYQKTLVHRLLLLVFKIVKSLQCILKWYCRYGCYIFWKKLSITIENYVFVSLKKL